MRVTPAATQETVSEPILFIPVETSYVSLMPKDNFSFEKRRKEQEKKAKKEEKKKRKLEAGAAPASQEEQPTAAEEPQGQ